MNKVEIDFETVDRITVCGLKSYRDSLQEQLKSHTDHGTWMHPEDVLHNTKMVDALNFVLRDFGERCD